jgi:hypothetical protein
MQTSGIAKKFAPLQYACIQEVSIRGFPEFIAKNRLSISPASPVIGQVAKAVAAQ